MNKKQYFLKCEHQIMCHNWSPPRPTLSSPSGWWVVRFVHHEYGVRLRGIGQVWRRSRQLRGPMVDLWDFTRTWHPQTLPIQDTKLPRSTHEQTDFTRSSTAEIGARSDSVSMSSALESVDAKNKLEDLSGVQIKPGENPYKALIAACNDDTVCSKLFSS